MFYSPRFIKKIQIQLYRDRRKPLAKTLWMRMKILFDLKIAHATFILSKIQTHSENTLIHRRDTLWTLHGYLLRVEVLLPLPYW